MGLPVIIMAERFVWSDAGHKMLSTMVIGERRLAELNLGYYGVQIDVNELGAYSIKGRKVIVALVGALEKKVWQLVECNRENVEKYRGHAYIVKGRKIFPIGYNGLGGSFEHVMSLYEGMDRSAPLKFAKTADIFRAGMGKNIHSRVSVKKGAHYTKRGGLGSTSSRPTASGDIACSARPIIATRRFDNLRLTCVCKCKAY